MKAPLPKSLKWIEQLPQNEILDSLLMQMYVLSLEMSVMMDAAEDSMDEDYSEELGRFNTVVKMIEIKECEFEKMIVDNWTVEELEKAKAIQ